MSNGLTHLVPYQPPRSGAAIPLFDDNLFFADGNPDRFSGGQFDERTRWPFEGSILRTELAALDDDFFALDSDGDGLLLGNDLFADEDLTNLNGLRLGCENLLTQ